MGQYCLTTPSYLANAASHIGSTNIAIVADVVPHGRVGWKGGRAAGAFTDYGFINVEWDDRSALAEVEGGDASRAVLAGAEFACVPSYSVNAAQHIGHRDTAIMADVVPHGRDGWKGGRAAGAFTDRRLVNGETVEWDDGRALDDVLARAPLASAPIPSAYAAPHFGQMDAARNAQQLINVNSREYYRLLF